MNKHKIAITMDWNIIEDLDNLVKKNVFTNRSQAVQEAVLEKLERLNRSRLLRECAKLDMSFEKSMAEEGIAEEFSEWTDY